MGFVLAQILCFGGSDNCDIKAISEQIYTSKSDCEFERDRQSAYYPKNTTECTKVVRPQTWSENP
jgi:hypothetical protein